MKNATRLICMLLALVMVLSMIPVFAAADTTEDTGSASTPGTDAAPDTDPAPGTGSAPGTGEETDPPAEPEAPKATATVKAKVGTKTIKTYTVEVSDAKVKVKVDRYIKSSGTLYEFSYFKIGKTKKSSVTIPAYDETPEWKTNWENTITAVYVKHKHDYLPGYNRTYHYDVCDCGSVINKNFHVDPATDADKMCTCGYEFSDNCDLVTLWLKNMDLSPRFNSETTEYIGKIFTYKDVTETSISTRAFDSLATIDKPTDVTIRDGVNVFQITVTAEDKTTTKTYTVTAVKPVKVNGIEIVSAPDATTAAPLTIIKNGVAKSTLDAAVADQMLKMADENQSANIALSPNFHKGSCYKTEFTLTNEFLAGIAQKEGRGLELITPYDVTVSIPAESLAELVALNKPLTFVVEKEGALSILAEDEAITAIPEKIAVITH